MFTWIISIILCFTAGRCFAGECCAAYYDLTFDYHDEKWCSDYCCGTSLLGILDCCDNVLLQASSDDRSGFCLDFFSKNVWAIILIVVGGLGMFLTCIACVYCCCKGSTSRGTVVAPAQQPYHTNLMMVNQAGVQHPGYIPAGPTYPPAHPLPQPVNPAADNQQTGTHHPFQTQPV